MVDGGGSVKASGELGLAGGGYPDREGPPEKANPWLDRV